jgi:hypothetical protein
MALKIELKRSAVPGKVPSVADLQLGEVAINTYDGKVFLKQDNGTQTIIQLASLSSSGSIASASYAAYAANAGYATNAGHANISDSATSASYAFNTTTSSYSLIATSASYASTSSYASNFNVSGNLVVGGDITAQTLHVQTITSSIIFSSGSNVLGNNTSNTQTLIGSVTVSGSFNVTGSATINNLTGSLYGTSSWALSASYVPGLSLSSIASGSVTASVNTDPSSLFLIKSGSTVFFNISSSSNTTLYSDLFIVKNFTTQQPVLTISQSVVQFATQSFNPSGTTTAGSIWFTSSSMYIGLEN